MDSIHLSCKGEGCSRKAGMKRIRSKGNSICKAYTEEGKETVFWNGERFGVFIGSQREVRAYVKI